MTRVSLLRAAAVVAVSAVALGSAVAGAGAAGAGPYTIDARALLGASGTDLTVRVVGPRVPATLDKIQVKAWPPGGEAHTRNFFDVPSPGGLATLRLAGYARGGRLELKVHVKDGPQHNVETETLVLRRPDLEVTGIEVPADVVRTRPFHVSVSVAEVGGDVGADARVLLFDGGNPTSLGAARVTLAAGGKAEAAFDVALARPREHSLRALVVDSSPDEWDEAPNTREQELYVNHYGQNGVVSSDHILATQIGADVLRNGGNAFDAAAAVQFALNVVQPHLNGIGGGSNIIVRDGQTGDVFAIDARETAPAATTATTYANALNQVRPNGFAVGVPGTVRAFDYLLKRWGTRSLAAALEPAIDLAEEGFPVGQYLATQIPLQRSVFQPETKAIFTKDDGSAYVQGEILKQPDLAKTFRLLARDGADAFYEGEIAQAIVEAQRRAAVPGREGKMTLADLRGYAINVSEPLSLSYKGFDVYAPQVGGTSGGAVLLESLGLMREFQLDPTNAGYPWGFATRNSLHVFIEAMRLAFADREFWLGDPRYTDVPTAGLLSPGYLRARSELIKGETVMCNPPSTSLPPGNPVPYNEPIEAAAEEEPASPLPGHTTHFSIIDRWGNAVVTTSTIRTSFGTGITVPGYGFLLNDSLGLFNQAPRAGVGNPGANDAAGGKRPLGNMTPTLILKDGELFAGTGTLGSDFIPSVVLNVVLNLIDYGLPVQQAVDAPRIWIRVPSGAAQLNVGLDHRIGALRAMGHVSPRNGGCAGDMNVNPLAPYTPTGNAAGPNVGSAGSFAVDLEHFDLAGGEDRSRVSEASTIVVERP